jgi:arsenate reductase
MAEGYLRHVAGNRFEATSAGIEPKELNPLAVKVMGELGIDISKQTSKDVGGHPAGPTRPVRHHGL